MSSTRKLTRLDFGGDGHSTVLSSDSRGGRDITDDELAEALGFGKTADLIANGVAMPLAFPGDCALANLLILEGELSEQEQQEWIGRISARLKIPCGKLLLVAGGSDPYDWENAVDEEPDDETVFARLDVPAGDYLVELYTFANSMTAAHDYKQSAEFADWFVRTRPGLEMPEFVKAIIEGNSPDFEDYVDYLLRLKPWSDADQSQLTAPVEGWFNKFSFREPELCPVGIRYSELGL